MPHKVITIAQQKGGAGKTTLAAHLAVAWFQRGFRVALIDIDPQGSLSHWHRIREERFGEGYTGIHMSQLSGWRVGSEISRLKSTHDIIIIDSPPHTETEARTAIRNADLVVVPVQPSPTDVWATKATVELCEKERLPFRVIMNRVAANSKLAQQLQSELPNLSQTCLGNRVAYASALLEGRGVTETAPSSAASQEIKALTDELLAMVLPKEEAAPAKAKSKERVLEEA